MQILNRAAIRRSNTGNIPVVDYWCLRARTCHENTKESDENETQQKEMTRTRHAYATYVFLCYATSCFGV